MTGEVPTARAIAEIIGILTLVVVLVADLR